MNTERVEGTPAASILTEKWQPSSVHPAYSLTPAPTDRFEKSANNV
jgi:hypothetical protein